MSPPLISAEGVSRSFNVRSGLFKRRHDLFAVRDVDLVIHPGEAVGIVGESGCGKSTLGRLLLGFMRPTAGRVLFEGRDLAGLPPRALRMTRRNMQMIFQDPYGSLDPRRRVGSQIADGLRVHSIVPAREIEAEIGRLLTQVGLDAAHAARLPHEFSGGQRQRIAIARALATRPDFIVADEPVSALDVSIQAHIVNLLADLRARLGMALLFISHDLHVVRHLCDRVAVMYLGRIVEEGPAAAIFHAPHHPYTRALLGATPSLRRGERDIADALSGDLPSPLDPPSGCGFRTRCPIATGACADMPPPLKSDGNNRRVACLRAGERPA